MAGKEGTSSSLKFAKFNFWEHVFYRTPLVAASEGGAIASKISF